MSRWLNHGVGAKVRAQNGEFEVLSRPSMLIKENTWRSGQHLLNKQSIWSTCFRWDKGGFCSETWHTLQLQGDESPGVLQFPSPMPTISDLLIRFLLTSQKSRLYSTVSPSKLNKHVHIQRNSNGKMIQACSSVGDHKASPFQGCNLSLHRWPSFLLMQGSWVCFQGGCCKPPGVFIEGSKTRMEGWWQNRKFLPPGREARGKIWIPQSRF